MFVADKARLRKMLLDLAETYVTCIDFVQVISRQEKLAKFIGLHECDFHIKYLPYVTEDTSDITVGIKLYDFWVSLSVEDLIDKLSMDKKLDEYVLAEKLAHLNKELAQHKMSVRLLEMQKYQVESTLYYLHQKGDANVPI